MIFTTIIEVIIGKMGVQNMDDIYGWPKSDIFCLINFSKFMPIKGLDIMIFLYFQELSFLENEKDCEQNQSEMVNQSVF